VRKTVQLGELVAAVFDIAAQYSLTGRFGREHRRLSGTGEPSTRRLLDRTGLASTTHYGKASRMNGIGLCIVRLLIVE
jgi:hypothetical protein